MRVVRGVRDRIQRVVGGVAVGVVVSAAGAIALTTATGQNLSLSAPSGVIIANQQINCVSIQSSGTLTVTGTSTHTFSGPVMVRRSGSFANMLIADMDHASDVGIMSSLRRQNAVRGRWALQASNDVTFETLTGSAGSETAIEALRFLNASGRMVTPTRFGVAVADPSHPLHVVGNGYISGTVAIGALDTMSGRFSVYSAGAAQTVGYFQQTAASATAPVLLVRLGATPANTAQEWQDNSGNVLAAVANSGRLVLYGASGNTGGLIDMLSRTGGSGGGTPAAPGSLQARLWYDDNDKRFKYIDSAGTTYTITAA